MPVKEKTDKISVDELCLDDPRAPLTADDEIQPWEHYSVLREAYFMWGGTPEGWAKRVAETVK